MTYCKLKYMNKCDNCQECIYFNDKEIYEYTIDYDKTSEPCQIKSYDKLDKAFVNKIAKAAERAERAWREAEFGDIVCHGDCDDHLGTCVEAAKIRKGNWRRKDWLINNSRHFQNIILNKNYLEKYCDTTNITEDEIKWTLMTINTSKNDGSLAYFHDAFHRFHSWTLEEIQKQGGLRQWLDYKYEERYDYLIGWKLYWYCKGVNNPKKYMKIINKHEKLLFDHIPEINWEQVRKLVDQLDGKHFDIDNIMTIEEYAHKKGYVNSNCYTFEDYGFKLIEVKETNDNGILFKYIGKTSTCVCENSIIINGDKIWSSKIYRYQKDGSEVSEWHGEYISNEEFLKYMKTMLKINEFL